MKDQKSLYILGCGLLAKAASQLRLYDLKKKAQAIQRQKKCDELNIQNQIAEKKAWRCQYCGQVTYKPPVKKEITRHQKGAICTVTTEYS